MLSRVNMHAYLLLSSPQTHTHTHPCHTHTEQMWNWYSASPDRYALYFTDSALMHHSVKPRVGTSLVVKPSFPELVYTYHSPLGTWGGIILLCTSLALSCVCWVEADGFHARRALDVPCHSSLTCWHLPRHRRLCAALIGVTADLQIAQKNPRAVSICAASSQWMADKMHSSRTHTHAHASTCRFTENCSGVYKQGRQKHTHTHTQSEQKIQHSNWLVW